jgi:hypothetical protein
MQDVTKNLVPDRREKTKVAVGYPFQTCALALPRDFSRMNCGLLPQPADTVSFRFKRLGIIEGRGCNAFLAIMECVDIAGVARCGAV